MKRILYITVSVIALGGLDVSAVNAQETASPAEPEAAEQPSRGVEDIVVTAQKRGENLQDVPIAITAISSETLQAKGITDVLELTRSTPNIYAAPFTISNSTLFFFMRGMGVGNPGQITTDPSIGVYENGIYNPRAAPYVFDLLDPERVEILRGPQGTLYGRNTTGGALNVVSRAPSGEFELRQLASYGSRNQYRSVTNLDFPAVGALSLKGTLAFGGDDGFADNIDDPAVTDTNDFGMSRHIAGRVAARLELSDNITADYSFMLGKQKTTGGLLQTPALEGTEFIPGVPYRFIRDQSYRPVSLPWSETTNRDHGLTLEWRASDALTLRSITGFRHHKSDQFQDLLEAYGLPITVNFKINSDILTQEVQAVGSAWDNRIKYAAGLYYFRENADFHSDTTFAFAATQSFDIDLHSVSKAAYAQVTVTPPLLGDRLDLTLGARQTWDKKEASRDGAFAGTPTGPTEAGILKNKRFNPAATIPYRWNDSTNTYAKVSTGYRAGGFDEAGPVFTKTFDPESLTSYEIGLKTDLFDRRVRANFAAFYNKFKDIQLPLATDPDNPAVNPVFNAGRANIKGIEADITVAPIDALTLNLNYAYLDANVTSVQLSPAAPDIANLFVIPYAPKHSLGISGDLVLFEMEQGRLILHADYTYKSSVFASAGAGPAVQGREFYRAPSQEMVNGRITLERELFGKPAQISVFAKNLFNNRFISWVSASGTQAPPGYFNQNFFLTAPRTIGVEVSFGF